MNGFDINDARDFQTLTLGSAAGILQTLSLAGRNPSEWDLLEGAFNGVKFHVFQSKSDYSAALAQVQDIGGRRKVRYKYPYKDGQTTDDLGRKPEDFSFEVLIFGNKYMKGLQALLKELNKPNAGELIHPIRGKIKCVPVDYEILHIHEKRKAAQIRLQFTEHNFTIGDIRDFKDKSVKGALASALDALATINSVLTNITGAVLFAKSLRNQITQALTDYRNRFSTNLGNMNKTFNSRGSADLPGLLPVNEGGRQNPDGTISNNSYPVVTSPSDRLANVPLELISDDASTALAVAQITKDQIALREQLGVIIELMSNGANGQGALVFYDDILNLKNTAILAQDVLERGIASSQSQIISYVTPHDMSLREVCFANGLSVERVIELELLNFEIESINFLPKGTTVSVPIS